MKIKLFFFSKKPVNMSVSAVRIERRGAGGNDGDYDMPVGWGNVADATTIYNKEYKDIPCTKVLSTGGVTPYTSSVQLYPVDYSRVHMSVTEGTDYSTWDQTYDPTNAPIYVQNPTVYSMTRPIYPVPGSMPATPATPATTTARRPY
jgi:hypothetical protein